MGRITRLSSARASAFARVLTASVVTAGAIVGLASPGAAAPERPPAVTEQNDTNDNGTPNNVVDSGDNAHPSGRDRSVEAGGSGNQGSAASDPDDNRRGPDRTNGGSDQPNRPGGADKADQDGNNGCGNDDDFEDDNEGRCGGARPAQAPKAPQAPKAQAPKAPKSSTAAPASPAKHGCSSRPTGNGGGANGSGAYGSTCDGSPSGNGNGGGSGGGRPCAGCVGNADDKNPPGQRPNGNDHNAGYECDRNRGVGRGNPAHSGCSTAASIPPPTTKVPPTTPPTTTPPTTNPPTTLPPTTVPKPPKTPQTPADEVLGTDVVAAQGSSTVTPADVRPGGVAGLLATTGLPVPALAALAATALIAGGAALTIRKRITR